MSQLMAIAKQYASEIQGSATSNIIKTASVRLSESVQLQSFNTTVGNVLTKLGSLQWPTTGTAFTDVEKRTVANLIDGILGVRSGTIWLLKESSIQSRLEYENTLSQVLYALSQK